jgi:glucan phosphoethanolaminetransferase (alkaline phosphatase superfamily)
MMQFFTNCNIALYIKLLLLRYLFIIIIIIIYYLFLVIGLIYLSFYYDVRTSFSFRFYTTTIDANKSKTTPDLRLYTVLCGLL